MRGGGEGERRRGGEERRGRRGRGGGGEGEGKGAENHTSPLTTEKYTGSTSWINAYKLLTNSNYVKVGGGVVSTTTHH